MLKGMFSPMITILDKERRIDFKGNEELIERLIKSRINGILFMGSTGEFFAMNMEERKQFTSFAVNTVKKRVPVLIGTGGTSVDETIELTKFAEMEGADAAVVVSPYYFKLNDRDIYNYYSEVAKSTEIPVIIYNFPDRTGVNINPDIVLKLAGEFENIKGIKDTVDGMSHTRKIIDKVKSKISDFAVFSGFEEYALPNLISGGDGLIGGLTNAFPEVFVNGYNKFKQNDFQGMMEFQRKVNKLMQIYDVEPYFISAIKEMKILQGMNIEAMPKKPYNQLDKNAIDELKRLLGEE